ncbi:MAG: hypothetical protein PHW95_05535 [Patescibacteria group bacterium]|nr:hypothetical protein [Patescibacteria group bacterium]
MKKSYLFSFLKILSMLVALFGMFVLDGEFSKQVSLENTIIYLAIGLFTMFAGGYLFFSFGELEDKYNQQCPVFWTRTGK